VRLVQDLLFLEELDFGISLVDGARCLNTTKSMRDAAASACELVGLELVDYDSCVFRQVGIKIGHHGIGDPIPLTPSWMSVRLRSRAWRERTERYTPGTGPR
jgi:hypothetical protein